MRPCRVSLCRTEVHFVYRQTLVKHRQYSIGIRIARILRSIQSQCPVVQGFTFFVSNSVVFFSVCASSFANCDLTQFPKTKWRPTSNYATLFEKRSRQWSTRLASSSQNGPLRRLQRMATTSRVMCTVYKSSKQARAKMRRTAIRKPRQSLVWAQRVKSKFKFI